MNNAAGHEKEGDTGAGVSAAAVEKSEGHADADATPTPEFSGGEGMAKKKDPRAVEVGKRLLAARIESGMNQSKFAAHLDLHLNTYRGYEKGLRFPQDPEVRAKICESLGWTEAELLGYAPLRKDNSERTLFDTKAPNEAPLSKVPRPPYREVIVRGVADATGWFEMSKLQSADRYRGAVPVMPGDELPEGATFAILTAGTSSNRIAPPDSWLICVDIRQTGEPLEDGDWVVVEQHRESLGLIKFSVHRIQKAGNGWDLHYESGDPEWSEVIHLADLRDQIGDRVIEVTGRVVFTLARRSRRR